MKGEKSSGKENGGGGSEVTASASSCKNHGEIEENMSGIRIRTLTVLTSAVAGINRYYTAGLRPKPICQITTKLTNFLHKKDMHKMQPEK